MYCTKCGKENLDSSAFCSSCGAPLSIPAETNQTNNSLNPTNVANTHQPISSAKYIISLIMSCCIVPITIILRLALQKTKHAYGWREYTYAEVPDNAKAFMIILAIILALTSIIVNIVAKVKKEKSGVAPVILSIFSIIASVIITMIQI